MVLALYIGGNLHMKKMMSALLTLILLFNIAGCQKEEEEQLTKEIEILNYEGKQASLMMEYVVQQWEDLFQDYGITFNIRTLPFADKLEAATVGDYEMTFSSWSPDYAWPTTYTDLFRTEDYNNELGYSNEQYDQLVSSKGKTIDQQWNDLQKAEEVLLNDAWVIPTYQSGMKLLINPSVSGLVKPAVGPLFLYQWCTKDNNAPINLLEKEKMPTLDPYNLLDSISFTHIETVNEGLIRLGKNLDYQPGVAKDYSYDEASKTWTFNLRHDAYWLNKNGEKVAQVTANDFKFAWDRVFAEDSTALYSFIKDVAAIESYEAVDDYTFQVTVSKETPYFLNMMSFATLYPINEQFYNQLTDVAYGSTEDTFLSNGPYYLQKWDHMVEENMVKNPYYWNKDDVLNTGLHFRIIEDYDQATGVALFEAKEIDIINISGEYLANYQDDPRLHSYEDNGIFYFEINRANNGGVTEPFDESVCNPLLKNENIRKALAYSLNKDFIVNQIDRNGEIAANYLIPQHFVQLNNEPFEQERQAGYLNYDLDLAKQYLEKGMQELGYSKK